MSQSGRRISVGFQGGQVMSLRVSDAQLAALTKALGGEGWTELESDEGPVKLDIGQVVYVRAESDELRVGFSA